MAEQWYMDFPFKKSRVELIAKVRTILRQYAREGYAVTVRQLYYQLVAMGIIPNSMSSYKIITNLCNDARLAGMLDWDIIEDRTRSFRTRPRWASPSDFLKSVLPQFHMDMWAGQDYRPFVIVEKEALAGVMARVCNQYDVPYLAAKGYPSVSVLRDWVKYTLIPVFNEGQRVAIIHLGDHDPSGIDMSRDLQNRVELFSEGKYLSVEFKRIALNMDQIEEYDPPPNPAKVTDSRFEGYAQEFGDSSWELDALKPSILHALVQDNIRAFIDEEKWEAREDEIRDAKEKFKKLQDMYNTLK